MKYDVMDMYRRKNILSKIKITYVSRQLKWSSHPTLSQSQSLYKGEDFGLEYSTSTLSEKLWDLHAHL